MKRTHQGFSLIELLIVVAIIMIIAAISIPNLLRSKMAANEASAVGSVRTINTAAIEYDSTYGNGFPSTLVQIGGAASITIATCNNSLFIDSVLGGSNPSVKSGYSFTMNAGTQVASATPPTGCAASGYSDGYGIVATPQTVSTTGQRQFCSDATGIIRSDPTGVASMYTAPSCTFTYSPLQ